MLSEILLISVWFPETSITRPLQLLEVTYFTLPFSGVYQILGKFRSPIIDYNMHTAFILNNANQNLTLSNHFSPAVTFTPIYKIGFFFLISLSRGE